MEVLLEGRRTRSHHSKARRLGLGMVPAIGGPARAVSAVQGGREGRARRDCGSWLGPGSSPRLRPRPRCASGTTGVALQQPQNRWVRIEARDRKGLASQGHGVAPNCSSVYIASLMRPADLASVAVSYNFSSRTSWVSSILGNKVKLGLDRVVS